MFQSDELSFSLEDNHPDYQVLKIEHEQNIHPSLLASIPWPNIKGKGLIIDGAKPLWLIAYLGCRYKNTVQWVAVANPREGVAVANPREGEAVANPREGEAIVFMTLSKIELGATFPCPHCGSSRINRNGKRKGKQRFLCRNCKKRF